MIDRLSPRERLSLEEALGRGCAWPRVILDAFACGSRLLLGIDASRSEEEIAALTGIDPAAVRAEVVDAARFCDAHGLHLLGLAPDGAGGERRHFMAVG